MFLLPWLIALCIGLWWHVDDFYRAWKAHERATLSYVEARKRSHGQDYFEITRNEAALRVFRRLDANGKVPLATDVDYHYHDTVGGDRSLQTDIFLAFLLGLGIPGLTIAILSFQRKAPPYFDRRRRFVVTPNGSPWLNDESLYVEVLGFVARFMENGRDDVWPQDWEGRRGVYLFENRRPADFDARLERVLAHIDREQINAQADALATEWGFQA